MSRWQAELTALVIPPAALVAAVEAAGRRLPSRRRSTSRARRRAARPGGRLAGEKTFTRGDVIVAVAPHLHGLPLLLDQAVEAVLAHMRRGRACRS